MGLDGEEHRCGAVQHEGSVVTCIAIAEQTRRQVEHSDEERHEHVGLVVLARRLVDGLHHVGGVVLVGRGRTEQRVYDPHQHGCCRSLAADVADAEEQLLVADIVVIEVAADLTGGFQHSLQLQALDAQLALWQHALLYLTGHAQLAVDAFLLGIHLLQPLQVLRRTPHNQSGKDETQDNRQHQHHAHHAQSAEDFVVVQHIDEHPVGISAHRRVEDMILMTILALHHEVVFLVLVFFQQWQHLSEQRRVLARQQVVFARYQKTLGGLIDFLLVHDVFQDAEGDIGEDDTDDALGRITDRSAVGCRHAVDFHMVGVRLGPKRLAGSQRSLVILLLEIFPLLFCHLYRHDGVATPARRIGFEVLSFGRIVVGGKGNAATPEQGVVLHDSPRDVEHPIRLVQRFAHHPRHVVDGHLGLHQLVADTKVDGVHLHIHHSLHRSLDEVLGGIEHETHHQLQQQYCRHDDREVQIFPQLMHAFTDITHTLRFCCWLFR